MSKCAGRQNRMPFHAVSRTSASRLRILSEIESNPEEFPEIGYTEPVGVSVSKWMERVFLDHRPLNNQPMRPMKTTIQLTAALAVLTFSLATSTWASPRSKVRDESNVRFTSTQGSSSSSGKGMASGSGQSNDRLIRHTGPCSKR